MHIPATNTTSTMTTNNGDDNHESSSSYMIFPSDDYNEMADAVDGLLRNENATQIQFPIQLQHQFQKELSLMNEKLSLIVMEVNGLVKRNSFLQTLFNRLIEMNSNHPKDNDKSQQHSRPFKSVKSDLSDNVNQSTKIMNVKYNNKLYQPNNLLDQLKSDDIGYLTILQIDKLINYLYEDAMKSPPKISLDSIVIGESSRSNCEKNIHETDVEIELIDDYDDDESMKTALEDHCRSEDDEINFETPKLDLDPDSVQAANNTNPFLNVDHRTDETILESTLSNSSTVSESKISKQNDLSSSSSLPSSIKEIASSSPSKKSVSFENNEDEEDDETFYSMFQQPQQHSTPEHLNNSKSFDDAIQQNEPSTDEQDNEQDENKFPQQVQINIGRDQNDNKLINFIMLDSDGQPKSERIVLKPVSNKHNKCKHPDSEEDEDVYGCHNGSDDHHNKNNDKLNLSYEPKPRSPSFDDENIDDDQSNKHGFYDWKAMRNFWERRSLGPHYRRGQKKFKINK